MIKGMSPQIIVLSVGILLLPLILTVISEMNSLLSVGELSKWDFQEWIKTTWIAFLFYGILSIGILKLNNKVRLLSLFFMIAMVISGPIGMIAGTFTSQDMLGQVIKKAGIWNAVVVPWLMVIALCIPFAIIAYYLNHREIKKLFK